jgi:hypothetical protein
VKIVAAKVRGRAATVTLRAPAAGKVRLSGKGMKAKTTTFSAAGTRVVRLKLSKRGSATLKRKRKLLVRLAASYSPATAATAGGEPVKRSVSRKRVSFRRR